MPIGGRGAGGCSPSGVRSPEARRSQQEGGASRGGGRRLDQDDVEANEGKEAGVGGGSNAAVGGRRDLLYISPPPAGNSFSQHLQPPTPSAAEAGAGAYPPKQKWILSLQHTGAMGHRGVGVAQQGRSSSPRIMRRHPRSTPFMHTACLARHVTCVSPLCCVAVFFPDDRHTPHAARSRKGEEILQEGELGERGEGGCKSASRGRHH